MAEHEQPDSAASPMGQATLLVRCDVTGEELPENETVVLHGYRVGARGKQILLDRLQAGDRLPGETVRPSVLRRFGCMVLDGVLMWIVAMVVMMPIFVAFGFGAAAVFADAQVELTMALVTAGASILATAVGVAYFTLMHARLGQTVGKMAGRLKLVQNDGQPVTMSQAFWRAMIYTGINFIPAMLLFVAVVSVGLANALHAVGNVLLGIFVLVNIIFALVDRDRQRALHDRLTGTRVILMD